MGREAFTGSRLLFMESEQEGYEQSLAAGTSMDFRADLMRRYFKRYPISLPHNEEPSSEWLAAVDDHEHDVEQDPESMSAEELATQKSLITVRRVVSLHSYRWQWYLIKRLFAANRSLASQRSQPWHKVAHKGHGGHS